MILNDNKTSLLVPSQFPKFVQENADYDNFIAFVQAYYEWMELSNTANSLVTTATTNQGITTGTKNIPNYFDIDNTIDQFIQYFVNDFLPYFPKDALISPQLAIKTARQLYQAKGTPASYKFLFRILYNSDFDVFFTQNSVLKASGGNWYIPKSLRLETLDSNFLSIKNLRLIGEISKSIATVENSIVSGTKTEVFISNIERLFQSGENVTVVDSTNKPVYFYQGQIVPSTTPGAETLTAKIVGQISNIKISPTATGQLYVGANTLYGYAGDPVVVYGGLSNTISNPVGATAYVGTVTTGSIQSIGVTAEGFGYSSSSSANSFYTTIKITGGNGAAANVYSLDPLNFSNVAVIPSDSIAPKIAAANGGGYPTNILLGNSTNPQLYHFAANVNSNWNTTLANAFTFLSFTLNPISSVVVTNAGGGISSGSLSVSANSNYQTDASIAGGSTATQYLGKIKNLGILAPIQIVNGGTNYNVGDTINLIGGHGKGAYANVASVNATGSITGTGYIFGPKANAYPLGGMNYTTTGLPAVTVTTSTGSGAVLTVPDVLGDGATFLPVTNQIGSVMTINIENPGEDYVAAPNVSFRVQDIAVTNYDISKPIKPGTLIYQGASKNAATYTAYVDSVTLTNPPNANSFLSTYIVRVYNYNTSKIGYQPLVVPVSSSANQVFTIANNYIFYLGDSPTPHPLYNSKVPGILTYGDGNALGTASFLNGLSIGTGQYIDTTGQLSGDDVLESLDYNSFTYQITVEKEIAKYRDTLLNLLHPSGINLVGRFSMRSNNAYTTTANDALSQGYSLYHYTQTSASNVTIQGSFSNPSNNILYFQNLSGANLQQIILSNTTISLTTTAGDSLSSPTVKVIDGTTNTATIASNVWLAFANVAYASAATNSNVINILSLTNSYNIVNGGYYSNTMYPMMDIIRVGDSVSLNVANSQVTRVVTKVDYVNNLVYVNANSASNASNTLLSVSRTMVANANSVIIYGTVGLQFFPQITDESGNFILTEDGLNILLG